MYLCVDGCYFYSMKRRILLSLFLALTISNSQASQRIQIEIKVNEINSLLQFLLACERNGSDYSLYKYVIGTTTDEKTQKMLHQWRDLAKYNMLKFEGYPDTRYNGQSVLNMVFIQSVNSKSIDELVQNCSGFYTQDELKKFSDVLYYFYPIYHQKLWLIHEKKIREEVKKLNAYIKQKNVSEYFSSAAQFYGVSWQNNLPFYVMVNPIAGQADYTTARPMGNVLIADYVLGDTDYNGWLGVVLHEMCHVLFGNQSRDKQFETEHYFLKSNVKNYCLAAYNWLDETMATAIGNGYVVEKLNGQLDKNEWYHNHYINANAKAIFPLVKSYLDSAKTIDGNFIYTYINQFEKTFSTINREANHLFSFLDVISDTVNNDVYYSLYEHFQPRVVNFESGFDSALLKKINDQIHNKIIIITNDHAKKIELVNEQLGLGIPTTESNKIHFILEKDGKNYIVMCLASIVKLKDAIAQIYQTNTFTNTTGSFDVK